MKKILLLFGVLLSCLVLCAESYDNYNPFSTEGKTFYVSFMMSGGRQAADSELKFYLYASTRDASAGDVTVTVTNPSTGWNTTFTCNSNRVGSVLIPNEHGYLSEEDERMQRGLIVTTKSANISLYVSTYATLTYGATNVLPVEALSKEYVIQTYSYDIEATEFAIVATKNGTKISITPSKDNIKRKDGSHYTEPFVIELDSCEAYLLRGDAEPKDLSGTIICSNYPIAVFNGGQNAMIPNYMDTRNDHIVEQSLPTYLWGKEFIVTNSFLQKNSVVKVTAMYDNTIIYINNQQEVILDRSESFQFAMGDVEKDFFENDSTSVEKIFNGDALYIKTSYPTICFSYHNNLTEKEYNNGADASMIFIPPLEQSISEISFLINNVDNEKTSHYVNVVTKTADVNRIELDSNNISGFLTVPGNPLYSYVRKELNEGSHKIKSTGDGFLAYVYGAAQKAYEAYAYNVGNNLLPLGAYMLLKGKRVNEMSFCYNENTDIEAIINYDYDNIEWYLDLENEPNKVHYSGKNKKLQIPISGLYDTTGLYKIKMVVTKTYPLCSGITDDCTNCEHTQDTVYAKLRIFDTCSVTLPTQYICEGESYIWEYKYMKDSVTIATKDSIIDYEGEFKMNLLSKYGCDSIITLETIIVPNNQREIRYDTICECCDTPYVFNNQKLYKSGIYIHNTVTEYGCDSTVELRLTVYPCYDMPTDFETICENDTITWHKKKYYKGNGFFKSDITYTYYDSLKTNNGCDSIHKLELYVAPVYNFTPDTIEMCDNEAKQWFGHFNDTTFQNVKAGTYIIYDSLKTVGCNCDSIYKLVLIVHPTSLQMNTREMCQHDTFTWQGKNISYSVSGTYLIYDTTTTNSGCQSIYGLEVIVHPTYQTFSDSIICAKDTLVWEGDTYVNLSVGDTILVKRYPTQNGCDSIFRLNLYVAPIYHKDTTAYICERDSFYWGVTKKYYSVQGEYNYATTTIYGCDSTFKLNLILKPVSDKDTVVRVCNCELPYNYPGDYPRLKNLTVAGIYSDTLQSKLTGCDSILNLELIIDSCYLYPKEKDTICINKLQEYKWEDHDSVITDFISRFDAELGKKSGLYTISDSNKTIYGCDSVYTLELYVAPIYHKV